jgi:lysozyme family protein
MINGRPPAHPRVIPGPYGWLWAAVKSTGRFDDALLHLIYQTQPVQLIASLSLQRKGFMERLRQFTIFKKGWLSRVNHVESVARTMSL